MSQTFHTRFFRLPMFTPFYLDTAFGGVATSAVLIKIGNASAQIGTGSVLTRIGSHQAVRHYPLKYKWRPRASSSTPLSAPLDANWSADMDDAPLARFSLLSALPAGADSIYFRFYRLNDPGSIFTPAPAFTTTETHSDTLDTGEHWGARAAWYRSSTATFLSAFSNQQTFDS